MESEKKKQQNQTETRIVKQRQGKHLKKISFNLPSSKIIFTKNGTFYVKVTDRPLPQAQAI